MSNQAVNPLSEVWAGVEACQRRSQRKRPPPVPKFPRHRSGNSTCDIAGRSVYGTFPHSAPVRTKRNECSCARLAAPLRRTQKRARAPRSATPKRRCLPPRPSIPLPSASQARPPGFPPLAARPLRGLHMARAERSKKPLKNNRKTANLALTSPRRSHPPRPAYQ